jgi:hypothetical protein
LIDVQEDVADDIILGEDGCEVGQFDIGEPLGDVLVVPGLEEVDEGSVGGLGEAGGGMCDIVERGLAVEMRMGVG